jgi:hypothetical protein
MVTYECVVPKKEKREERNSMKLNKSWLAVNAAVSVILLMVACGSSQQVAPPPTPTPKPGISIRGGVSASPSYLTFGAPVKTAQNRSKFWDRFSDAAEAQSTPTVTITGNYSGYCTAPWVGTQSTAVVLYGAGVLVSSTQGGPYDCNYNGFNANGVNSPGLQAASNMAAVGNGAPIIGNGTLSGLVVIDSAKSVATSGNSGLVEVFDIRGGNAAATGITCTLGSARRCEDATHTFAVLDGDSIVLTLTGSVGDVLSNVQFFLGKQ